MEKFKVLRRSLRAACDGSANTLFTFLTVMLIELAYTVNSIYGLEDLMPVMMLFGYAICVLSFSFLKFNFRRDKLLRRICTMAHIAVVILVFSFSCYFRLAESIVLTIVLFSIPQLLSLLKRVIFNAKTKDNMFYGIIGMSFVAIPYAAFVTALFVLTPFTTTAKIVFSVLYLLLIPSIIYYERFIVNSSIYKVFSFK